MSSIKYQLKKRLYRLKAFRRKGFGIHSPFTYHLITNVIEAKLHYYAFEQLQETRSLAIQLLKTSCKSTAMNMVRANYLKEEIWNLKKGEAADRLIFRLMNFSKCKNASFLGSGLSYTSAYMAKVDSRLNISCVGDCIKNEEIRNAVFKESLGIENIHKLDISNLANTDFVVISDIISDQLINDFSKNYKNYLAENCTVVFLNMHKTQALLNFWKRLKADQLFKVSLDLFYVGILVARDGMQKQDYVRKYRF